MKFLGLIIFCVSLQALAQTSDMDAVTGKVYYAEEVLVKDSPQVDLYHRAKAWFATSGNSTASLQADDANGILIGGGSSLLSVREEDKEFFFRLYYTVKIETEDDRYWYRISDFSLQKEPLPGAAAGGGEEKPGRQPLETWCHLGEGPGTETNGQACCKPVKAAVHQRILSVIEEISAGML